MLPSLPARGAAPAPLRQWLRSQPPLLLTLPGACRCRSPTRRLHRPGALREWHPISLGAKVVDEVVRRSGGSGEHVEDVIVGCVSQVGAQAGNIGRNIVMASGLPETVPGTAVDRQCGSSQQAIHFAAQAVMSGTMDVTIAAGVEHMTGVPIGANVADAVAAGHGVPSSDEIKEKYGAALEARGQKFFSQFEGAEIVAEKFNLSREDLDSFAVKSHERAVNATENGYFDREILPLEGLDKEGNTITHSKDEGIRPGTNMEGLAKLKDLKGMNSKGKLKGIVTAGTSSQICDGASAILIANEAGLKKMGVKPRAKIIGLSVAAADPVMMLSGPIPATQNMLERMDMKIDDFDLYEVNEAFAPVPLAWAQAVGADKEKLNVNGGAMALGHPLGGTGCKLMTTLLHELERRGDKLGIQVRILYSRLLC